MTLLSPVRRALEGSPGLLPAPYPGGQFSDTVNVRDIFPTQKVLSF